MDATQRPGDCIRQIRLNYRTLIEKFLLVVLFSLVFTGCLSIPVSTWWQTENTAHHSQSIPLNEQRTITVDYPAIVLLDDKPASLSLSLATTQPLTQPLTVTVQLPRELVLAAPPQTYRDSEPSLTFPPAAARVQTQTLPIANARLVGGLEQTQAITLTTSSTQLVSLPIRIEGTWRVSLRGFFSNQFNMIITALLSAAGLLFTLFEKQRQADENRRKEEAEKTRNQANQGKNKFRELMRSQNGLLAQQTFNELGQSLNFIAPDERVWMGRLLRWSKGDLAELDIETIPPDWLNETAGALVCAFNNGQGKAADLRQLPIDKLADDVRDAVQAAIALPEQARYWPPYPAKPNLDSIAANPAWQELPVNPFPHEYAEDDVPLLFSEVGAFWNEHPLYRRMGATNKPAIIAGAAGTGKTALALALSEYWHDKETLGCYLPGLPEEADIYDALAKKILTFVCQHPTLLRQLGPNSRTLLAHVCVNALGTRYVLARLDSLPIEETEYVKQTQDEKDRKARINVVRSIVHLFRDCVKSLPTDHSSTRWSGALVHCARSLDFKLPIQVVIDANAGHCLEWINTKILPLVPLWRMDGISVKIFVSSSVGSALALPEDHSGWLGYFELTWKSARLLQMLDHRFKSIMQAKAGRVVRPAIVADELWRQMIEKANNNPRGFIQLWNRMLDLSTDGTLSKSVLDKALEGFKCP